MGKLQKIIKKSWEILVLEERWGMVDPSLQNTSCLGQGEYGLTLFDGNYVGRVTHFGLPWPLAILILPW